MPARVYPRIGADGVPAITADQMREVDRTMIEDLRIELVQMMENAGRNLAELAIAIFGPSTATVLAGPGGNGGGGLVAARHLANRGVAVRVVLSHPEGKAAPLPALQLDILRRVGVPIVSDAPVADVVLDALIGYGLRGHPRGPSATLIEWANEQTAPVLSLDAPSGLDATTGETRIPCVRANATLTLALPKIGLFKSPGPVGRLFLVDISVPPLVYRRLGIEVPPLFGADSIVELVT